MSTQEDGLGALQSVLAEEEEENLEVKDPKEGEEEEEEEEKEEEVKEEFDEDGNKIEKEDEEEETEDEQIAARDLRFKEVKSKYPELFKDFPHLRHAFFHAKEYREIFPTVEEAKEAAQDIETMRSLETALSNGKPKDVIGVLNSFKGVGENVVEDFSTNFLGALREVNQDLYYETITPELVSFVRNLFDTGVRNENENFQNAALVAAKHFFGNPQIASGEAEIKPRKEEPKVDEQLEKDRAEFRNERYTTFYNDVIQSVDEQLLAEINDGIDPRNVMTDGVKELIAERVMKEINTTLGDDPVHKKRMDNLWKKASDGNFGKSFKSSIETNYLETAKGIMPKIRSKVRSSVLGVRERHSEKVGGKVRERREPKSNAGGGGQRSKTGGNGKNVDWGKTSDIDFLKDDVTFKD